ncbi:MAG: hypothetical protein ACOX4P_06235 [Anaerovoracaceae bacterium]|jgi:hypothetical protein
MKVFIVFISLLIVNMSCIIYQGDLNRYIQLQTFIKAAAEECAAGAALYYDEEAYGQGLMVINEQEALKYADYIVGKASNALCLKEGDSLAYEMQITDDGNRTGGLNEPPSVEVELKFTTDDMFRLSFLKVDQVVRKAKYELAEY